MSKLSFESGTSFPVCDSIRLELMRNEIREISERNEKAHQYDHDYHLSHCLDQVLELLDEYIDYDPTPQFLYDNSGGEPPVTFEEIQENARQEKLEAWQ
jgi:hypothetical protein